MWFLMLVSGGKTTKSFSTFGKGGQRESSGFSWRQDLGCGQNTLFLTGKIRKSLQKTMKP